MKNSNLYKGIISLLLACAAIAVTNSKKGVSTSGYCTGTNLHCTEFGGAYCVTDGTVQCTTIGHGQLWEKNLYGRCVTKVFKIE
jgi:hypothetical protein